jgi:hypothetical protein
MKQLYKEPEPGTEPFEEVELIELIEIEYINI